MSEDGEHVFESDEEERDWSAQTQYLYSRRCAENSDGSGQSYTVFEFKVCERTIKIDQKFHYDLAADFVEHGLTVWDSAMVLLKFFENPSNFAPNFFRGKRVLELGSGTGLLGIGMSCMGAEVVVTDYDNPAILQNLQRNVDINTTPQDNVTVRKYNWGEDPGDLLATPFDLIVASDVLYDEELAKLFIKGLVAVCTSVDIDVYVAAENHSIDPPPTPVEVFEECIPEFFHVEEIGSDRLHATYQAPTLKVFRLKRKTDQETAHYRQHHYHQST